jgi:hypothetical protein
VQNVVLRLINRFIIPKWLPLAVAISVVLMPNNFLLLKLFGGLFAVVLFYFSITSNNNIASKDLIE